jgi:LmbE family N-acetylglucosaminyl deacetylase
VGSVTTVVFVHAHPDDEALLTAGTMAKATAHGHRVVLVMATDGAAGLARTDLGDLATLRAGELDRSAQLLGVQQVVRLGYRDSGLDGTTGFAQVSRDRVAADIAEVATDVKADILVGYDASGGYGHPDHLQVHQATRAAWSQLPTHVRLFEATLPREPIARAVHLAKRLRLTPRDFDPREFDNAWTPRAQITHRVNVRDYLAVKRAAQAAHASQASADSGTRTLAVLGALPNPLARVLLGTEFYYEVPEANRHCLATVSASSDSS